MDVKAEATEDKGTGWSHLVEHWRNQLDVRSMPDKELEQSRQDFSRHLIEANDLIQKFNMGDRTFTFAALNARQARYTGWLAAITEEQMRRRYSQPSPPPTSTE